jgi:PAS domain-containing protein
MDELLLAVLRALPLGIIVVDADGRVVAWNTPAEEFITAVRRPTLFEGMTLDEAHSEESRRGMTAMVQRLREGRTAPRKRVLGEGGQVFDVSYEGLFSRAGAFLGIAQVIAETHEG